MASYQEELGPDNVPLVLWQRKAWADLKTNIEWAEKGFGAFVKQHKLGACLLLCDNLTSQTKDEFAAAVKKHAPLSEVKMGPKAATHLWQPVDHNVGAAYHRLMGEYYDEWIVNPANDEYFNKGGIPAEVRRLKLVEWAQRAWTTLEAQREADEAAGRRSLFYRAFEATGCLVTDNKGHGLDHRISQTAVEEAYKTSSNCKLGHEHKYDAVARPSFSACLNPRGTEEKKERWNGVIEISSSEEDASDTGPDDKEEEEEKKKDGEAEAEDENSEDQDDDEDEDGDFEPLPDNIALDALPRSADELRDWKVAKQVARGLQEAVGGMARAAGVKDMRKRTNTRPSRKGRTAPAVYGQ
jgi:hypothetical protein